MLRLMRKLRKFVADMDKVTLVLTIVLFGFGLFSIATASSREAVVGNINHPFYFYFEKQIKILCICFFAYLFILCFPTKMYKSFFVALAWIGILGANIFLVLNGVITRGASNWIKFGSFQFQPGEFAKPILIVTIAIFIESTVKYFRNPKVKHWVGIAIMFLLGLTTAGFIVLQKDFGTAAINIGIFGVMFLASPILPKEKRIVVGGGVCLLACLVILSSV